MEIQIKSTDQLTTIDGVTVRLWQGVTADGIPCQVFVHMIAAIEDGKGATAALDRELKELPPPREVALRAILN